MAPSRADILGLVLAGGRGQRLGSVDKGLQPWRGLPLVDHALARLRPQVREVMISANRNADVYATRATRVLADDAPDFPGPLAGILAGLRAAASAGAAWVAVVPCDSPALPADLVARLAGALSGDVRGAVVQRDHGVDGLRLEPVCCLLSTALADDLAAYLASGERKVERWLARHAAAVLFDREGDDAAFANINTPEDLAR